MDDPDDVSDFAEAEPPSSGDAAELPADSVADDPGEALLHRALSGDRAALGQLLDRFRPLLRAKARESLGEPLRARIDESDVVQQTCLLVVRRLDQLRGRSIGEFIAWLLQVHEHNLLNMVDLHRGAAKRDISREQPGEGLVDVSGRQTSPSQKAMRSERRRQLEQAIDELPEGQRDAVRMRFLEEASLADIARRMERSEEAVAGLLKRGIAQLKRSIRDQSDL